MTQDPDGLVGRDRLPGRCTAVAILVVAFGVAACAAPAVPAPSVAATATATVGDDLPPCGQPPSPDPDPPPPGAVLPPVSRITAVRRQPPVVQLNGYVESTPGEIQAWVEQQENLEIVASEHTPDESQFLVTDGTWRTFIKARAICDDASLLAEVIAPLQSDAVIPTPAAPAS